MEKKTILDRLDGRSRYEVVSFSSHTKRKKARKERMNIEWIPIIGADIYCEYYYDIEVLALDSLFERWQGI